jgi:hypothetical protein
MLARLTPSVNSGSMLVRLLNLFTAGLVGSPKFREITSIAAQAEGSDLATEQSWKFSVEYCEVFVLHLPSAALRATLANRFTIGWSESNAPVS